jgi:hypothetical protein
MNRDWKKLTFYYFADAYINFNSLVTDLFKFTRLASGCQLSTLPPLPAPPLASKPLAVLVPAQLE